MYSKVREAFSKFVYQTTEAIASPRRSNPTCTSYDGILSGTVDGVITLKNASGVSSLIITGGTEVGPRQGWILQVVPLTLRVGNRSDTQVERTRMQT